MEQSKSSSAQSAPAQSEAPELTLSITPRQLKFIGIGVGGALALIITIILIAGGGGADETIMIGGVEFKKSQFDAFTNGQSPDAFNGQDQEVLLQLYMQALQNGWLQQQQGQDNGPWSTALGAAGNQSADGSTGYVNIPGTGIISYGD